MSRKLWGLLACSANLDAAVSMYETMLESKAQDEWDGCKSIKLGCTKLYTMCAPDAPPIIVIQVEGIHTEVTRLRSEGFEVTDPFEVRAGLFAFLRDKNGTCYALLQPHISQSTA